MRPMSSAKRAWRLNRSMKAGSLITPIVWPANHPERPAFMSANQERAYL
jgi:hypothetical protein